MDNLLVEGKDDLGESSSECVPRSVLISHCVDSRVRIANVQRAIVLLIDSGWRMRWSHNNDTLDPACGDHPYCKDYKNGRAPRSK